MVLVVDPKHKDEVDLATDAMADIIDYSIQSTFSCGKGIAFSMTVCNALVKNFKAFN
jgi:hypothetical protein